MSRNGSGDFSLLATFATAGQAPSATSHNNIMDDIADALSDSINKDGTKAFAANQSVGGFKFTSLGSGSARTDSINYGQVQDGKANWVDGGGTADAITATYSPAITALVDGQLCFVRATAANATTTPTFAPNGLTARTIVKNGGSALVAGDIVGDGHELILRYDLTNTRWELLNPRVPSAVADSATEVLTGTDTSKFVTADALAALWEQGSDITSAATISVGEGGYFNVTGTTDITDIDFATDKAGRRAWLKFAGALKITNGASLISPTGLDIYTSAGDLIEVVSEGSDVVRIVSITRASSDPRVPDVIIEDQKAQNTDGGTFTTGADRTRDLNTLVRNAGTIASLATNQFTLLKGNYYIEWSAPAYLVDEHQSFLYNVTGTAEVKRGTVSRAPSGAGVMSRSEGSTTVSVTASTAFEIRHRCTTTQASTGFGIKGNFGTEVYTRVSIWRLP